MSMMDQENRALVAGKISFYGIVGMRSFVNRRLDVRFPLASSACKHVHKFSKLAGAMMENRGLSALLELCRTEAILTFGLQFCFK